MKTSFFQILFLSLGLATLGTISPVNSVIIAHPFQPVCVSCLVIFYGAAWVGITVVLFIVQCFGGISAYRKFLKTLLIVVLISFLNAFQASSISKFWQFPFIIFCVIGIGAFIYILIRDDMKVPVLFLRFSLILVVYEIVNLGMIIQQSHAFSSTKEIKSIPHEAKNNSTNNPHIFLIVFDEFALTQVLDGNQLSRQIVPNLEDFSQTATWHRNARTLKAMTDYAIPTLLLGTPNVGAFQEEFLESPPTNHLFKELAQTYHVYISGYALPYCKTFENLAQNCRNFIRDFGSFRYLFLTWWKRAIPGDIRQTGLIRPLRDWIGGFFTPAPGKIETFTQGLDMGQNFNWPVLTYIHVELPHGPYMYNSQGQLEWDPIHEYEISKATSEELKILESRYVEQIKYTDTLFGEFLLKLKQLNVFDDSLIIITSDHGMSFSPENPGRKKGDVNIEEIARIPLIVKLPGQNLGRINDQSISLADVYSIILQVLKTSSPLSTQALAS